MYSKNKKKERTQSRFNFTMNTRMGNEFNVILADTKRYSIDYNFFPFSYALPFLLCSFSTIGGCRLRINYIFINEK